METEQFEALMMYVLVGGLMLFMFFIICLLYTSKRTYKSDRPQRYID